MAVVTLFMSDRDISKTFTSKKEADEYDKLLELAEAVSYFMAKKIKGLSEQQVEEIGLVFARNKDLLAQAIKGKSDVLFAEENESTVDKGSLDKGSLDKG
jgi:dsDNA-binding SOS-regulon protein